MGGRGHGNVTHATEFNIKDFLNKVSWNKERYTVTLPWKPEISEILPDKYSNILSRLRSSISRFKKTPELFKEYDDVIKKQEENNIIEMVTDEHKPSNPGEVHYLPHQAVIRLDNESSKKGGI